MILGSWSSCHWKGKMLFILFIEWKQNNNMLYVRMYTTQNPIKIDKLYRFYDSIVVSYFSYLSKFLKNNKQRYWVLSCLSCILKLLYRENAFLKNAFLKNTLWSNVSKVMSLWVCSSRTLPLTADKKTVLQKKRR